jgi:hypothetical protein
MCYFRSCLALDHGNGIRHNKGRDSENISLFVAYEVEENL